MELINNITLFQKELKDKFSNIMVVDDNLSRQLVSFQANKKQAFHKWFKYKEGFSADLVRYIFHRYKIDQGPILDPFAGIGTSLFISSELGLDSLGIELLPSSNAIIKARKTFIFDLNEEDVNIIKSWIERKPWNCSEGKKDLTFFRITNGAYPEETKQKIENFLFEVDTVQNEKVKEILFFSVLSILESISYTRKDGQYLRWDHRSGRQAGTIPFDKGEIPDFDIAINKKLKEIIEDYINIKSGSLFNPTCNNIKINNIKMLQGSCLELMPTINDSSIQAIITSPPYCNRYDYTRTYALELGLLDITQKELNKLRQTMLSCTVENKEKDLLSINNNWEIPLKYIKNNLLLQSIIEYLEVQKGLKTLNNNGIVRMIKNYFTELSCIIYESYRVLKKGGYLFMVNDNVRYAGICIPIDLILSELALNMGFVIENILILPIGKGNSSQQMGEHGREELRKCIYVWRK